MSHKTKPPRFIGFRFGLVLVSVLAACALTPALFAQESFVRLDPSQTKIEFTLGDVLHTVHGLFKLKSCTIRFDPSTSKISGAIVVDATSGASGNEGRDRKMHREILESDKFPEIVFTARQMKGILAPQGSSHLEVLGRFQLHGQDHDLTLPVDILPTGQVIQLATSLTIPYVQWGLKNPSTFILRVSDKVTIDIHAVGHFTSVKGTASSSSHQSLARTHTRTS